MTIVAPTGGEVSDLLEQFNAPVGYVVGVVSPQFKEELFFFGSLSNYNGDPMPFHGDIPFEIASLSKIFTASLLTKYTVENPELSTMSVTACTPPGMASLPASFDPITLLNLANYTSGLPDDSSDVTDDIPQPLPEPYTKASMYGYLHDDNVPVSGTGTTFTYSNMAPSLLANAIPVAVGSDLDFASLLAREITGPLGMSHTRPFMEVSFTELPQGFSNGQAINAGWNEFPAFTGGSGMVSTANDMLIWLRFHMGMTESPLKAILAPMQTPSTTVTYQGQLGIGWFLTNITATNDGEPVSLPIVYKAGELYGNSSFICFLQSTDPGKVPSPAGIIFLTNNMVYEAGAIFVLQLMLAMNGYPKATNVGIG